MGKVTEKRFRNNRFQQIDMTNAATSSIISSPDNVSSVLAKLQSVDPEEKECACIVLTHMCTNHTKLEECLSKGIVKILGPLLHDSSACVRLAAIGALRNLSVEGGTSVCEKFVADDVMTPLLALCSQVPTKLNDGTTESEVFVQAIQLLCNLCESSETVLKLCSGHNILQVLLPYMHAEAYGYHMALAVGRLFYTISEDVQIMEASKALSLFNAGQSQPNSIVDSRKLLHGAYCAGILYNCTKRNPQDTVGALSTVAHHAAAILAVDSREFVTKAAEEIKATIAEEQCVEDAAGDGAADVADMAEDEETGGGAAAAAGDDAMGDAARGPSTTAKQTKRQRGISTGDHPTMVELAHNLLQAQQVIYEVLANLCSPDAEFEDCDDDEDGGSEDSSTDDIVESMQVCTVDDPVERELKSLVRDRGIVEMLYNQLVNNALHALQAIAADATADTTGDSGFVALLETCQSVMTSLLLCINNIGGVDGTADDKDWLKFVGVFIQQLATGGAAVSAILEPLTSALRATVEKLNPDLLTGVLTETHVTGIASLLQTTSDTEIHVNVIRIIGRIGCAAAKKPAISGATLQGVGSLLQQAIGANSINLQLAAEALDVTFDVFAEDDVNEVLVDTRLLATLKHVEPGMRRRFQEERKKYRDHVPLITTSLSNLRRFLKYKQKMIH